MIHRYTGILFGLLYAFSAFAQGDVTQVRTKADALFKEERFAEAMPLYSQLISLNPSDHDLSYRYGTCVLHGGDKEKAVGYLKFAVTGASVPADAWYWLGRAYHLNYQFKNALEAYGQFRSKAEKKDLAAKPVDALERQCQNGQNLLSDLKEIDVRKKVEVDADEFFRFYDLSDIGGKIVVMPEELKTSLDKKKEKHQLIYLPDRPGPIYFSSYGKDGKTGKDIYRTEVMPNGSFATPVKIPGYINTDQDEDFPFLHSDGRTFYFSSKGHNSMGGYDVFKATYDSRSDGFGTPENMDFAVNTPDDDFLYIVDPEHKEACFASSRSSHQGKLHVYRVSTSQVPLVITVLQGTYTNEIDKVDRKAKIVVEDALSRERITEVRTAPDGSYVLALPRSGKFRFLVECGPTGKTHVGTVDVPGNDEPRAFRQELALTRPADQEKLVIRNFFDQPLDDDLIALALDEIRRRASLDVNEKPVAQPERPAAFDVLTRAGFTGEMDKETVQRLADDDAQELEVIAQDLDHQAAHAYTIALEAVAAAETITHEAEKASAEALLVNDEAERFRKMSVAADKRNEAKIATTRARVAFRTAKDLEAEELAVRQKAQSASKLAADIRTTLAQEQDDAAVPLLTTLKERLDRKARPDQDPDPLMRAERAMLDKEKEAKSALQRANSSREDALDLTERIKRLEDEKARAKNNKREEEIDAELAGYRTDLAALEQETQTKFKQLRDLELELLDLRGEYTLKKHLATITTDPAEIASSDLDELGERIAWADERFRSLRVDERFAANIEEKQITTSSRIFEWGTPAGTETGTSTATITEQRDTTGDATRSGGRTIPVQGGDTDRALQQVDVSHVPVESNDPPEDVAAYEASGDVQVLTPEQVRNTADIERELPRNTGNQVIDAATERFLLENRIAELEQLKLAQKDDKERERIQLEQDQARTELKAFDAVMEEAASASGTSEEELWEPVDLDRVPMVFNKDTKEEELINSLFTDYYSLHERLQTIADPAERSAGAHGLELMLSDSLRSEMARQLMVLDLAPEQAERILPRIDRLRQIREAHLKDAEKYLLGSEELAENSGVPGKSDSTGIVTEENDPVPGNDDRDVAGVNDPIVRETTDPNTPRNIDPVVPENTEPVIVDRIEPSGNEEDRATSLEENEASDRYEDPIVQGGTDPVVPVNNDPIPSGGTDPPIADETEPAVMEEADPPIAENIDPSTGSTADTIVSGENVVAEPIVSEPAGVFGTPAATAIPAELPPADPILDHFVQIHQDPLLIYSSRIEHRSPEVSEGLQRKQADIELMQTLSTRIDSARAELKSVKKPKEQDRLRKYIDRMMDDRLITRTELGQRSAYLTKEEWRTANDSLRTLQREVAMLGVPSGDPVMQMAIEYRDLAVRDLDKAAQIRRSADRTQDIIVRDSLYRKAYTLELQALLQLDRSITAHNYMLGGAHVRGEQITYEQLAGKVLAPGDVAAHGMDQEHGGSIPGAISPTADPATAAKLSAVRSEVERSIEEKEAALPAEAKRIPKSYERLLTDEPEAVDPRTIEPVEDPELLRKLITTTLEESIALDRKAMEMSDRATAIEDSAATLSADQRQTVMRMALRTRQIADSLRTGSLLKGQEALRLGTKERQALQNKIFFDRLVKFYYLDLDEQVMVMQMQDASRYFQAKARSLAQIEVADEAANAAALNRSLADGLRTEARYFENEAVNARMSASEAAERSRILMERAEAITARADSLSSIADRSRVAATQSEEQAGAILQDMDPTDASELRALEARTRRRPDQSAETRPTAIAQVNGSADQPRSPDRSVIDASEPVNTDVAAPERTTPVNTPADRPITVPPDAAIKFFEMPEVLVDDIFQLRPEGQRVAQPILRNAEMPKGLVFKVQIGAFRNEIEDEVFSDMTPVMGEDAGNGLTRYTAGLFNSFDQAFIAKDKVRSRGYRDAFVVAYLDGKRIPLGEAMRADRAGDVATIDQTRTNNERPANTVSPTAEQSTRTSAPSDPIPSVDRSDPSTVIDPRDVVVQDNPLVPGQPVQPTRDRTQENVEPGRVPTAGTGEEPARSDGNSTPTVERTAGTTTTEPLPVVTEAQENERILKSYPASAEAIIAQFKPNAAASNYYPVTGAAPARPVEMIMGLFFTVQVGVYTKPVELDKLYNITPLVSELTETEKIRYSTGVYPSMDGARERRLQIIDLGVKDAFVTAYLNGERIPIRDAVTLLAEHGPGILSQP